MQIDLQKVAAALPKILQAEVKRDMLTFRVQGEVEHWRGVDNPNIKTFNVQAFQEKYKNYDVTIRLQIIEYIGEFGSGASLDIRAQGTHPHVDCDVLCLGVNYSWSNEADIIRIILSIAEALKTVDLMYMFWNYKDELRFVSGRFDDSTRTL